MKRKGIFQWFVFIGFGVVLHSCEEKENAIPPRDRERTATGAWALGAGANHPESFRNFHYTFNIDKDNSALDVTLASPDTEVALWLYNPLGQVLASNWGSRSIRINEANMGPGQYRLVAGTYQRGEAGKFTISMKGSDTELTPIPSETLAASNEWKTGGGGVNHAQSPRNHRYKFEVTQDNQAVDVVLNSDDVNVAIWLLNPLGQPVGRNYGDRSHYLITEADKGVYTIIAGTYERNVQQADYQLSVNGQVTALQPVAVQDATASGTITNGAGVNVADSPNHPVYTFDVTENNTALDVILESPDFDVTLWLYNPNGQLIYRNYGDRRLFTVQEASVGKYKVVCGTYRPGDSGNYKVSVVGKFGNFTKQ